jgi:hypothetical protein
MAGIWQVDCKTMPDRSRATSNQAILSQVRFEVKSPESNTQRRRTVQPVPSLLVEIYGEYRAIQPVALLGSTSWPLMCPSYPSSLFDLASLPIMLAFSSAGTKTSHS